MLVDTHCHIDQYRNPFLILEECELKNIKTIAVTNLPSHYEAGYQHVKNFKNIRLALGLHPLLASKLELKKFLSNIENTSYIGEIGLDFSNEGIGTKDLQIHCFKEILSALSNKNKFISIHSRGAEQTVVELIKKYNLKNIIFHWYSGSLNLIDEIIKNGNYFSINPQMIKSKSGKKIINKIPLDRLLTESDGPYINLRGKEILPKDVEEVTNFLALIHDLPETKIKSIIYKNFKNLISSIK